MAQPGFESAISVPKADALSLSCRCRVKLIVFHLLCKNSTKKKKDLRVNFSLFVYYAFKEMTFFGNNIFWTSL